MCVRKKDGPSYHCVIAIFFLVSIYVIESTEVIKLEIRMKNLERLSEDTRDSHHREFALLSAATTNFHYSHLSELASEFTKFPARELSDFLRVFRKLLPLRSHTTENFSKNLRGRRKEPEA